MSLRRFPTSSGELYFGEMPSVSVLKFLKHKKVHAIWNLASELAMMVPYEKLYVGEVIMADVSDFKAPSNAGGFLSQLNHIVSLLKSGKKVFVHCFGGRGRTGMALAAINVALEHANAEDALHLAYLYSGGPESLSQDKFVENLDKLFNPKKEKVVDKKKSTTTKKSGI